MKVCRAISGFQHVPGTEGVHDFLRGVHWTQGTRAPSIMKIFIEMRMAHRSHVIHGWERRRSMTAKADLVHAMAVMATVARIEKYMIKESRLAGIKSHECFPKPKYVTRCVANAPSTARRSWK